MGDSTYPLVRINKVYIKNYKAIDELEIDFPKPCMKDELDVFVLGSRNGVGKTSVLECCGMFFLLIMFDNFFLDQFIIGKNRDMLIRTGETKSTMKAIIESAGEQMEISFRLVKNKGIDRGQSIIQNIGQKARDIILAYRKNNLKALNPGLLSQSLFGINPNPLVIPFVNYFHSFRKVREGNTKLGIITNRNSDEEYEIPPSTFKMEVMQLLMSKVGLFEGVNEKDAEFILNKLNSLVQTYAKGEITKLKSFPDESIDLLITPGNIDTSYPFDSLSSGQKEIITTLFLIWKNTQKTPGIVLIDEPELHLNAEWHRGFVSSLKKLAPHNQYILATHSEDVFESVDNERRILIEKG